MKTWPIIVRHLRHLPNLPSAFYIHSGSEADYLPDTSGSEADYLQLPDTNTKKRKFVSHSLIFSGRCAPLNILLKDIADYSNETRAPWMKPKKSKIKGGKSYWRFICQQKSRTPDNRYFRQRAQLHSVKFFPGFS